MSQAEPWLLALTVAYLKLLLCLEGAVEAWSFGLKLHNHCLCPKYQLISKPA